VQIVEAVPASREYVMQFNWWAQYIGEPNFWWWPGTGEELVNWYIASLMLGGFLVAPGFYIFLPILVAAVVHGGFKGLRSSARSRGAGFRNG